MADQRRVNNQSSISIVSEGKWPGSRKPVESPKHTDAGWRVTEKGGRRRNGRSPGDSKDGWRE